MPHSYLDCIDTLPIFSKTRPALPPSPRNVVAVCGDLLFVAHNASLAVTHLESNSPASPFLSLLSPDLEFSIESLVPNSTGEYLAVQGARGQLVVVCVDHPVFTQYLDNKEASIDCRTLCIGNPDNKTPITKMIWHPLSRTQACLMVLTRNGLLSLFDIARDLTEPEQIFLLGDKRRNRDDNSDSDDHDDPENTSDSDSDIDHSEATETGSEFYEEEDRVLSFAVGSLPRSSVPSDCGWEAFTLYYALPDGFIYSICPVLPHDSLVPEHLMHTLCNMTSGKLDRIIQSSASGLDGPLDALYHLYQLHHLWLLDIMKAAKYEDNGMVRLKGDAATIEYPLKKQGPFIFEKKHDGTLSDPGKLGNICDMAFIQTQPLNLMVLAYDKGRVRICLLENEIDPQWNTFNSCCKWQTELLEFLTTSHALPRASVYEERRIAKGRLSLMVDPIYPQDTIHVFHTHGSHIILMEHWTRELAQLDLRYRRGQGRTAVLDIVDRWSAKKNASKIKCLVDTQALGGRLPNPVVGLAAYPVKSGRYIIAITKSGTPLAILLGERTHRFQPAYQANRDKVGLPLPTFVPPCKLQELYQVPPQPRLVACHDEKPVSKAAIKLWDRRAEQIKRFTRTLDECSKKTERRIILQEGEYQRQKAMVEHAKTIEERSKKTEARAKEVLENHKRLVSRVRHLVWEAVHRESENKPSWPPVYCFCNKPHPHDSSSKTGKLSAPANRVKICGQEVSVDEVMTALSNLSISSEQEKQNTDKRVDDKGKGKQTEKYFRFP
ncbi:hypothetical protein BCR43DRAFT_493011 [Syncephalastrum racemosum]|uniref:Uncharacterized protein n=1 Tax=Syncephalastrum racemosum TaxID=13706 RepID=A0A1X2H9U9_SYNRA|nr:hypothetical protein BCR43DRAFT_493011 [Syncephalastrum racemosum]